MTPFFNITGQSHTQWPPLYDSFYTRWSAIWLLSAAQPFKFSHNLLFSYLFWQFSPFYSYFHCLANLAPNASYSMDFYSNSLHFVTFCTEWSPFFKGVYWMTPLFKIYTKYHAPYLEVFLGITGCPKWWVGTYLSLQIGCVPPPPVFPVCKFYLLQTLNSK